MQPIAPDIEAWIGRALRRTCAVVAMAGGLVLIAMAAVTVASVAGRAMIPFGLAPVRGDFELVEMGCAVAVFAFLPWCQITRAHVTVDVVAARLPPRGHAMLGLVGNAALALCAFVIAWRLALGAAEKVPYGSAPLREALGVGPPPFFPETTYELQVPVWIPFALATFGAVLFLVTAIYTVWRSLNWTLAGREPDQT